MQCPAINICPSRLRDRPHVVTANSQQHGAHGALQSDWRWQYHWNSRGRLIGMTTLESAVLAGAENLRLRFFYDEQGRRIRKISERLSADGASVLRTTTTLSIYDGWLPLGEIIDDSQTGTSERFYTWGNDLDGSYQGMGGAGGLLAIHIDGETYVPVYDGNANIIALIDNANGREVASWTYGPFGEPLASSGNTSLCPMGFATSYRDAESGHYYFGYRYYNPESGRWLSREPLGEMESWNLYAYCHNDPINKIDVLGLASRSVIRADEENIVLKKRADGGFDVYIPILKDHIVSHRGGGRTSTSELGLYPAGIYHPDLESTNPISGMQSRAVEIFQLEQKANKYQTYHDNLKTYGSILPGGRAGALLSEGRPFSAGASYVTDVALTATGANWVQKGKALNSIGRGAIVGAAHGGINELTLIGIDAAGGGQVSLQGSVQRVSVASLQGAALGGILGRFARVDGANSGGAKRSFQYDESLRGTTTDGYFDPVSGVLKLKPGMSASRQAHVLRHENVHKWFYPKKGPKPLLDARRNADSYMYNNSAFFNATEEVIAEKIASRSLRQGFRHAFSGAYTVRGGTRVTLGSYLPEAIGVGAVGGGFIYGGYQLGNKIAE